MLEILIQSLKIRVLPLNCQPFLDFLLFTTSSSLLHNLYYVNLCIFQQSPARRIKVSEGAFEVSGEPGIGDFASGKTRELHHIADLDEIFGLDDAFQQAFVGSVHYYNKVGSGGFRGGDPVGGMRRERNSFLSELRGGGWIQRIALLFVRDCCGGDCEAVFETGPPYELLHYEFRHRAPADVPVAHENDFEFLIWIFHRICLYQAKIRRNREQSKCILCRGAAV